MCGSVCSLRKSVGVTAAVVAVVLLAITAIALAAIFAPPFFATALLGIAALPVAISAGIGALVAIIAAVVLLKKRIADVYVSEDDAAPPKGPMADLFNPILQHRNFTHFQTQYNNLKKQLNRAPGTAVLSQELLQRSIDNLLAQMDAYTPSA